MIPARCLVRIVAVWAAEKQIVKRSPRISYLKSRSLNYEANHALVRFRYMGETRLTAFVRVVRAGVHAGEKIPVSISFILCAWAVLLCSNYAYKMAFAAAAVGCVAKDRDS